MVEIKPGPELDRAVAEAIGCYGWVRPEDENRVVGFGDLFCGTIPGGIVRVSASDRRLPDCIIPNYSHDLNAAFAAAEKVGLFDARDAHIFRRSDEWYCSFARHILNDGTPYGITHTSATTLSLAICKAILTLKKIE